MYKILLIAKLSDIKLTDKIMPLKEAFPNSEFYVLRRMKGPNIENVKYLTAPKFMENQKFLGTFYIFLKGILSMFKLKPNFLISYFFIPHGIVSILISKIFKKKVICSIIGTDQLKFENNLFSNLYVNFLRKSDVIVVTGSKLKSKLESKINITNKIQIIPNSKKISIYHEGFEKREIDFLFVGGLIKLKQVDVIIQAFNKMKKNNVSVTLYIVGDGPEKSNLQKLTYEYKIADKVIFTGYEKNVNIYFKKTKFIVLASQIEGLPSVLIEGMMNGCIPITTDVGDITDIVSQENGFLIEYKKNQKEKLIEDLTNIFEHVIKMKPEIFEDYSNKNIEISKRYDYSYAGKLWLLILRKIL